MKKEIFSNSTEGELQNKPTTWLEEELRQTKVYIENEKDNTKAKQDAEKIEAELNRRKELKEK